MKKVFATLICFFILISATFGVDLSLRVVPSVMLPTEKGFPASFVGHAQADFDLFGFLTVGGEGTVLLATPEKLEDNIFGYGGGIGIGAYYFPLSRLYVGAGATGGLYTFTTKIKKDSDAADDSTQDDKKKETVTASDFYYRAYGEIGYRFNPSFTLNLTGGYAGYLLRGNKPLLGGPFIGISGKVTIPMGKGGSSGFKASLIQDEPAYPLFMSAYRTCPLATVVIQNQEGAEIKNVKVSFRAGKYTASTFESGTIPVIKKYGTAEIPLYADFSTEILRFSETGKISGELVVEYSFLGKKMNVTQNVVLDVYNRNAFSWTDSTALAAFISPETPEILEFAKYVAGIARNGFRTGLSRNLEMAAAIYEALKISGVEYTEDKSTPYSEYHFSTDLDEVQYPLQTMNMLGGDYDDLGILLASCLESVGVPTAYLITEDDFIVLVNMQIKPTSAGNHFDNIDKVLVDDETVYFGLSMKNFDKGFNESLKAAGDAIIRANVGDEVNYDYVDTHYAWEYYAPAVYTGSSGLFKNPSQALVEKNYKTALDGYLNTEINGVIENARKTGDSNKIGLALVRVGRYDEAKKEFKKSNTVQAKNNLANIYILEKNYTEAINQFNAVLSEDPENATAKKGLDKVNTLMGF